MKKKTSHNKLLLSVTSVTATDGLASFTVCSNRENHEKTKMMDQETAQRLFREGATFVFLGVPPNTQFGIDLQCWSTEEQFRGVKMIPPGLHYVHYAASGRGAAAAGNLEPR